MMNKARFLSATLALIIAGVPLAASAAPLPANAFPFVASGSIVVDLDQPVPLVPGVRGTDTRIHVGSSVVHGRFTEPEAGGRHPAVLFVHWLGDPATTNMTEFAPEALALARRGVVALTINAMWSEPNWFDKRTTATDYRASLEQVAALRGALDALLAHPTVDPANVAFVGHDFGAMYGAVLAGLDARPRYYVFIAGTTTFSEWYLLGKKPADVPAYMHQMAPLDPLPYLGASLGKDYFFQFALKDRYVPLAKARVFFDASPAPKAIAFYAGGHDLRSKVAIDDRVNWLLSRLTQ
jgi:dienelactone hydrolase